MNKDFQHELTEDMEVIGPGQMLREGRKSLKLSQKDVAEKLNFTLKIVKNIEDDKFDKKLPSTYTRGYLKNFARLVQVSEEDVLDSYELLGVAAVQQAEMQSFSNITTKRAENNRLMWFSYLVLALLITSTVVWWVQEHQLVEKSNVNTIDDQKNDQTQPATSKNNKKSATIGLAVSAEGNTDKNSAATENKLINTSNTQLETITELKINTQENNISQSQVLDEPLIISKATFTFSGDCWVNIYDATGERVAWGIKKADYVMNISGQAPFSITLGKPELVSINFNEKIIDMSKFNSGNIAKFTLPLNP